MKTPPPRVSTIRHGSKGTKIAGSPVSPRAPSVAGRDPEVACGTAQFFRGTWSAAPAAPARHTGLSSPARSNVVAPVVEEDEDDLPAISRRSAAPVREEPAPASAERKPQFTVQDFLKRQQR